MASMHTHLTDVLPADEQEQDRLDIHHALMMALMDDKLHFAPLSSNIQRAVDLGTGTGMCLSSGFDDQLTVHRHLGNAIR